MLIPKDIINFVFDIDGTLVNTELTAMTSLHDTIQEMMGLDLTHDQIYKYFSVPSSKVAGMLGCKDEEGFLAMWNAKWDKISFMTRLFDKAEEMVLAAKSRNGKVGVVTSRSRFELDYDVCFASIRPLFDIIVTSEDCEKHKPDPAPMLRFMDLAGIKAETCLYLGDARSDCECCHAAGARFALADWSNRGSQGIPVDWHFTKAEEFLHSIGKCNY